MRILGHDRIGPQALGVAQAMVVKLLRCWRPDLECLDGLLLLAISLANIDAVLEDTQGVRRYGGAASPNTPDALREPITPKVLAISLGLPQSAVARSVATLVAGDECTAFPQGLLVTRRQADARRKWIGNRAMYETLRGGYWDLRRIGFFGLVDLPRVPAAESPPLRSGPAHGAKFVLRALAAMAPLTPDARDALIVMRLLRVEGSSATVEAIASALGMSVETVRRRTAALAAKGLCASDDGVTTLVVGVRSTDWLRSEQVRHLLLLAQLFIDLAKVGAVADFHTPRAGSAEGAFAPSELMPY